ncbi:MAG: site-2 protease family protein [Verrucomicrobiales bacterium]
MIRFTILGFPVSIHWMFWLTAALISGTLDSLEQPGALWYLGIWIAVVFLSVLWHELGHVIFQRKFGARPEIMLVAFGGLAIPHGARFTRKQAFIVAAAGPCFGLLLWVASMAFFRFVPPAPGMQLELAWMITFVNLIWSIVNLLPVLPLDGGHMLQAALGPRRLRVTAAIGMVVAGLVAIAAFLQYRSILMPLFFAYFAWQNFQVYKQGHGSIS